MSVLKITNENYQEEVLKSNKPVIIDFYADWCGPCRMMAPIIDEIAEKLGETAKVGKVNVDENQELALKTCVEGILTGNYLTTTGKSPQDDIKTLEKLNKKLKRV